MPRDMDSAQLETSLWEAFRALPFALQAFLAVLAALVVVALVASVYLLLKRRR